MKSEAGLCATCAFCRVIENRRGSRFYLCLRSETDARYRKYPRLPVLVCEGYEEAAQDVTETQPVEAPSKD